MLRIVWNSIKGKRKEVKRSIFVLTALYICSLAVVNSYESILSIKDDYSAMDFFFREGRFLVLAVLVAIIIVTYLIYITLYQREYSLMLYKTMGASNGQVIWIILLEHLFVWGISIVVGMLGGSICTWVMIVCGEIVFKIEIPIIFNETYTKQILLIFSLIYIFENTLLPLGVLTDLEISNVFTNEIISIKQKSKVKITKNKELNMRLVRNRNKRANRNQVVLRILISTITIVFSAIILQAYLEAEDRHSFWKNQKGYEYVIKIADLPSAAPLDTITEIGKLPGMVTTEYEKMLNCSLFSSGEQNDNIKISCNRWASSEYVKNHRRYSTAKDMFQVYDKEGDYFVLNEIRGIGREDKMVLEDMENTLGINSFDKEAFLNGDECVVILAPYQLRDQGYDTVDYEPVYVENINSTRKTYKYDGEMAIGDTVTVNTLWGTQDIAVGGIIYTNSEPEFEVIMVSDDFLDKIYGIEGKQLYNSIKYTYCESADFKFLDQQIEQTFAGYNANISNERLVYEEIREQFLMTMSQCMIILCTVWLVFILVTYQANIQYLISEKKRIKTFRMIGMDQKQLHRIYSIQYLEDIVCVAIICCVIIGIAYLFHLRKETSFDGFHSFLVALESNNEMFTRYCISLIISFLLYATSYISMVLTPIYKLVRSE